MSQTAAQPYEYRRRELVEPDWTRLPGWRHVTRQQWESAQWQRVNCVKNLKQLRAVLGDLVEDRFYDDLEADQAGFATMSMLLPPQMINTMVPGDTAPTHGPTRSTPTRCGGTCSRWRRTAARTGRRTRTPPATRCTSTTCGSPRD